MSKTVLIFDSGIGGLSIYKELKNQISTVNYVYVFDNAGFPYGELCDEELIERISHIIEIFCKKYLIEVIVIACNTASTIVLPVLRSQLDIPIVGVVPAIKPAALISQRIGLLATPATIRREYTKKLIESYSSIDHVKLLGSTRLVEIAEEKMASIPINLQEVGDILIKWKGQVDCIVLGCTHFPFLKDEIKMVLGDHVTLVDSGKAIARRVKLLLRVDELTKEEHRYNKIYCSASTDNEEALNRRFQTLGFSPLKIFPYPKI